jgi:ATP-dependent HslUV protease ATP-binding subunit HslU
VELSFSDEALREIAEIADRVNEAVEDIGARRLATVLERLLGPLLFDAPDRRAGRVAIDAPDVRAALSELVARQDLARFAL